MNDRAWWSTGVRVIRPLGEWADHAVGEVDSAPIAVDTDRGVIESNPQVAEIAVLPEVFSAEECRRMIEMARSRPFERGRVLEGRDDARRCDYACVEDGVEARWIYDGIVRAFHLANERFRYRLRAMIEPVIAVAYGPGDGFDWHLDAGGEITATRKLSLSLLLTGPDAYDGGGIEISGGAGESLRPPAGTAIIFPSLLSHRVKDVTRGTRVALVAFAHGPTFR